MNRQRYNRIINAAQIPIRAMPGLKSYNIIQNDDEVEIAMYGEVVETVPVDWWTGEQIDGLFIVLSDFLSDLDSIKNKSSVKVRINSIGGDLFAGVTIYNRLKEMDNVTTIVDGLAASAASIIAQAGKVRQVYQTAQVMVHGALIRLCDYYNVQQLNDALSQLQAANDLVTNVYQERTGETKTKLKNMVEKTTWMTGQEVVDRGFADEVISGQNVTMSMSSDKSLFLCNGIPMNAKRMIAIPQNVTVFNQNTQTQTAHADANKNNQHEGGIIVDQQELRQKYPDLVTEIENEAKQSISIETENETINMATAAERKRIQEIESIEASIADKDLIKNAKYGEKPMDAKELAFQAMQKQASLGNTFLSDNAADVRDSGTNDVTATPNGGMQEETKDEAADVLAAVNAAKAIRGGK
ncbi:head maturation protease, ClpP-related [Lachnotalea glycerini]|uniref:ATP-dependent Clp protease proteolytic subunit n=1 Tax=Lachnotalea glycerini TaxID=1763509 RepID=A0A371J7K3_9FIRM|nr:head maturation protease, ClpP-related [Lachnotalea glycerini]RDY28648.1 Clp protease ClpP [Lachnotalea glycerini]